MEFAVEVTSEGETGKVCLVNGEHELRVCGCQLRWLESEVVIKVTRI